MKRAITYGALALILIVGAFMIYGVIAYPAKQPYRDAKAAYQTVYNDNIAFTERGLAMNAKGATEATFKKNIAATHEALATLKSDTKKLGEQPVLKEGEGKEKYDAFSKQLAAYAAYNTDVLVSIEVLRPALLECSNAMAGSADAPGSVSALQDCSAKLKTLATDQKVPNAEYRVMALSFSGIYNSMAEATSDSMREDLVNELSLANNEFAKNLNTSRAKVDITETAKALDDYLSAKSRLFF